MTGPLSKDGPLERYVSILETVAPFAEGLTAAELEVALGLAKTTVNRLLHGLMDSGMIRADSARNRRYRLGDRALRLLDASPDTDWLERLSQRLLQALADRTGQSAFISKFDGTDVRSVTCAAPDTPVRTYVMPGSPMPVNAAATAKAIIAFQSEAVIRRILAQARARYTEVTKTDAEALLQDFALVRQRGYATDLAEHVAGLGTIAVPIRVASAPVTYAVGLTGPYGRVMDQDFDSHCSAITETAAQIAKLLMLRLPDA